jgi:hypothetical protein
MQVLHEARTVIGTKSCVESKAYDERGTGPNRKFRLPGKIKKEYPLVGYLGKSWQRILALRLTFRVLSPRAA